jgi:mono/diheme cytochrome c family protein
MPSSHRWPLPFAPVVVALVACAAPAGGDAGIDSMSETSGATEGDAESSGLDADATTAATAEESDGGTDEGADPSPETLYLGLCSPCHGADALGTELGYELRHPDHDYARWVVRNGRVDGEFPGSVMAAYPEAALSDDDLDAILDWLDAFPQPDVGEALYLDYCRNCHGPDARGGIVGKDISDKEFHDALEKVRKGEGGSNYAARALYMPAAGPTRLADDEVAKIAEFIAAL